MGLLSPGPGQKPHRAKNATSEDELTDAAEIVILLLPADSSASDAGAKDADDTTTLPRRLAGLMRRLRLEARISVPAPDAGEMLSVARYLTWAVLVIATLAIMVPSGMTPRTIITVIALELAGFVTDTLALRRRRKNG